MARNIEIKARIPGIAAVLPAVTALATSGPTAIDQDDTFFPCPTGRLKLREFADGTGELIFYQRPDTAGPKESFYVKTPARDPQGLRRTLELAYGRAGRVRRKWAVLAEMGLSFCESGETRKQVVDFRLFSMR